ncbi:MULTISPECIES: TniB family NTP-binding protein [Thalassospira]|uniref:TniB family NTP-binding protein n=1 Tax=Thalassospira TaxID=168934 RepID=UPI000C46CE65|nr:MULTISPECIES: TniB family NTP-binding protein [Thalassospira]MAB33899.1 hypothetical protein [Thalassospira sp.]MAZ31642.1 hypothetical protein [Thalassospira sp.]HBS24267.1 hypothetical protein [Thalassospira sp.]
MGKAHEEYVHIHPQYRHLANASDAARIQSIRTEKYINHPNAKYVLGKLDRLIQYPKRSRMPCLLLFGKPGMGKTLILKKFFTSHCNSVTSSELIDHPIVCMQMPAAPDEKGFFEELLNALKSPLPYRATNSAMLALTRKILADTNTKIIMIDEFHAILAGTSRQQSLIFNTIRFLTNALQVPIVCAGTNKAFAALSHDDQLADRFEAVQLPQWQEGEQFSGLINTISSSLPLKKPSELTTPLSQKLILERTQGITLRIFLLIEVLACEAIANGSEQITFQCLKESQLTPLVSMQY